MKNHRQGIPDDSVSTEKGMLEFNGEGNGECPNERYSDKIEE